MKALTWEREIRLRPTKTHFVRFVFLRQSRWGRAPDPLKRDATHHNNGVLLRSTQLPYGRMRKERFYYGTTKIR